MIKAIIFDFSRTLLNARDQEYPESLNALYKRLSPNENFHSLDHFAFNKKLLDFAAEIKDHYDLYIFTTGMIQEDIHLKSFIEEIFRKVFTIEEIRFLKNNKEAYTSLVDRLSLKPEEVIFLDDQEENVQAAKEAGLYAIQFISTDQAIKDIQSSLR